MTTKVQVAQAYLNVLLLPPATPFLRAALKGPSCTSNMPPPPTAPPPRRRTDARLPLPRTGPPPCRPPCLPPLPLLPLPRPLPLPRCPSPSSSPSSSSAAAPALPPTAAAAAAAAVSLLGSNEGMAAMPASRSDSSLLPLASSPRPAKMPWQTKTEAAAAAAQCNSEYRETGTAQPCTWKGVLAH